MNLVKLYGFLEHEDEKVIVVEYVGNGNLREHLDGKLQSLTSFFLFLYVIDKFSH